jgi:hypothetical protein
MYECGLVNGNPGAVGFVSVGTPEGSQQGPSAVILIGFDAGMCCSFSLLELTLQD